MQITPINNNNYNKPSFGTVNGLEKLSQKVQNAIVDNPNFEELATQLAKKGKNLVFEVDNYTGERVIMSSENSVEKETLESFLAFAKLKYNEFQIKGQNIPITRPEQTNTDLAVKIAEMNERILNSTRVSKPEKKVNHKAHNKLQNKIRKQMRNYERRQNGGVIQNLKEDLSNSYHSVKQSITNFPNKLKKEFCGFFGFDVK